MAKEAFKEKKFSAAHKQIIKQANAIIDEYQKAGYTLTLRQIHYQFVARDLYENTQQTYKRLGNILDHARKAGLVDWDAIEDRTRSLRRISVYDKPETPLENLARHFRRDPWDEQPVLRRVEVWVEKDAAVGIVQPTCDALRIPYFSCRGYSSSSGLYEAGKRLAAYADAGYETLILYLGDHDPSGVQMTISTNEKVDLFARKEIEFRRIALTLDQVALYNPPANFAKETDSRTKWYIDTYGTEDAWELDALSPTVVDALIREHVDPLIDKTVWDATIKQENEDKRVLTEVISNWDRTKAAPEMLELIRKHYDLDPEAAPDDDGMYDHPDSIAVEKVSDECGDLLHRFGL
jgi:hypothetical protein